MTAASSIIDHLVLPMRREAGICIKTEVSASTGAGTATSVSPMLARYTNDTTYFEGCTLWIPGAANTDDEFRTIASHSVSATTTTFTFYDTSNFAENLTTETAFIMPRELYFDAESNDILDTMNRALDLLKFQEWTPLAHGPDSYDMQGGNVDSDWTESNATDTVQTTATEVLMGAQSLVVTDSGSAGGYTASAAQRVGQGKSIQVHFLGKSDTGTSELQVIDGSSNEQADIVFTEEQWVYGTERVDFDSADETFTLRLLEQAASDSGDWQAAWFVRQEEYVFHLPTWITDRFTIKALAVRHYRERSEDSGSSDELYLAHSYDVTLLYEGVDYKVYKRGAAAHTRILELLPSGRRYIDKPIFMLVEHPWSAPWNVDTTFSAYTSTSNIAEDLLTAKTMELLGKRFDWSRMEQDGIEMLPLAYQDEAEVYTEPEPAHWLGPLGGRRV